MALDIDVLITFAEKDNATPTKQDMGWVSHFKKFLELMLLQVLGKTPNVVLKEEFDSVTASTLDNVSVLISILSKDFTECEQQDDNMWTVGKNTKEIWIFREDLVKKNN